MTKFKYNDKVLVTGDDSDGFFIGLEGVVKNYSSKKGSIKEQILNEDSEVTYEVWLPTGERSFYFKEDQIQKI